uniref:Uncharacterized protein n=1 Tax=Guillardia theta TaxID=55529 RepID=A0A6U5XR50_GUITH|mmetsp:Transcript_18105/g.59478  ORF Transcript_18105/g.59478 Transcript_18105/m.59478 type:complete len:1448 (+) Transcript_18105:149-4492(+)
MAERNNRGGVLPNLVDPDGVEVSIQKKRQYLKDLQEQAEADRLRKFQDKRQIRASEMNRQNPQTQFNYNDKQTVPFVSYQPSSDKDNFLKRMQQSYEAALQNGAYHVDDPTAFRSASMQPEVIQLFRRWEQIFVAQTSSSVQVVSELNTKLTGMEENIQHLLRERQAMSEKLHQGDLIQSQMQSRLFELREDAQKSSGAHREAMRELATEVKELRGYFQEALREKEEALATSIKEKEELTRMLENQSSRLISLEESQQLLQSSLSEMKDQADVQRKRAREGEAAQKDLYAQAQAEVEEVKWRIRKMEDQVMPESREYVDRSQEDYWSKVRSEFEDVRKRMLEVKKELNRLDSEASGLFVMLKEKVEKESRSQEQRMLEESMASEERLQGMREALEQEQEARSKLEGRMQKDLEVVTRALAEAIKSADVEHAALVEAVHKRFTERLSQQDEFSSAVREALEKKRSFLEEIVRTEIRGRFEAFEDLRTKMEGIEEELKSSLQKSGEKVEAQLKLLGAKTKTCARQTREVIVSAENAERIAQEVREELTKELMRTGEKQVEVEQRIRESMEENLAGIRLQLSSLNSLVENLQENSGGGRDVRDVGLTDKVDKLRSDLSALDDELHDRSGREEEKREQLEKFILELQSSALQLKDEVLQEKSRTSSDILSLREDLEQKNAHQAQELEDLRLHMLDVMKDLQEAPEIFFNSTSSRIDSLQQEVAKSHSSLEEHVRKQQEGMAASVQELSQALEDFQGKTSVQQLQARQEATRTAQMVGGISSRVDEQGKDMLRWKQEVEERMKRHLEQALQVRDSFAEELRQIQTTIAEHARNSALQLTRMDSKLLEDQRKMIGALESFKHAHEGLRKATDGNMLKIKEELERQAARAHSEMVGMRNEVSAVEEGMNKKMEEEKEKRKEVVKEVRGEIGGLREEVERGQKAAVEEVKAERTARKEAVEGIAKELKKVTEETVAREKKIREDVNGLSARLLESREEEKRKREAMREEIQEETTKLSSRLADVESQQASSSSDLQRLTARFYSHAEEQKKTEEATKKRVEEVAAATSMEQKERDAAITEVYKRMEVVRGLDSLAAQLQEQQMREELKELRTRFETQQESSATGLHGMSRHLEEAIEELKGRGGRQEGEISSLQQELEKVKSSREEEAAKLSQRLDDMANLHNLKLKNMEEELAGLEGSMKELGEKMSARAQEQAREQQEQSMRMEDARKQSLELLTARVDAVEQRGREQETSLDGLRASAEEKISAQQAAMASTKERIDNLLASLASAKAELEGKVGAEDLTQGLQAQQEKLQTFEQQMSSMKEQQETMSSSLDKLASELKESSSTQEKQASLEDVKEAVAELRAKLDRVALQTEKLQEAVLFKPPQEEGKEAEAAQAEALQKLEEEVKGLREEETALKERVIALEEKGKGGEEEGGSAGLEVCSLPLLPCLSS